MRNLTEAKWNDLKEVEKRRFFECFNENCPPLRFGYATFTVEDLQTLQHSHLLYTDDPAEPWDVLLTAFAYIEIVFETTEEVQTAQFNVDRLASTSQCDLLVDQIQSHLPGIDTDYHSSRQEKGIQAADCLAGGVREQTEGAEPWLDYIDTNSRVNDCADWALIHLEHRLTESNTGP